MYWLESNEGQIEISEEEYQSFRRALKKRRAESLESAFDLLAEAVGVSEARCELMRLYNQK